MIFWLTWRFHKDRDPNLFDQSFRTPQQGGKAPHECSRRVSRSIFCVFRLAGSILIEIDDEWQAAERRYFSLETMGEFTHPEVLLENMGPLRLAPIQNKRKNHRLTHWNVMVLLHH